MIENGLHWVLDFETSTQSALRRPRSGERAMLCQVSQRRRAKRAPISERGGRRDVESAS